MKINFSQIKDIVDDMDFCAKLAEEESVILLPGNMFFFFCNLIFLSLIVNLPLLMMSIDTIGVMVGLKNWVRISFAVDPSNIVDGFSRIKAFCLRYAKMS